MMTVQCPRCRGAIGVRLVGVDGGPPGTATVQVKLDPFDVRRHALCFEPPPDGEPLPEWLAA